MKYNSGAFVFYRIPACMKPLELTEITHVAQQYGVQAIPQYAGDREIAARCIGYVQGRVRRMGFLLEKIKASSDELVYSIFEVDRDQVGEYVSANQTDLLRWQEDIPMIQGDHNISKMANLKFSQVVGRIMGADWTDSITRNLETTCLAAKMRDDGRVYYMPTEGIASTQSFSAFLSHFGISLVVCEVEASQAAIAREAVTESLDMQIQALNEEVEAFGKSQRPSTYENKLSEMQSLRARALAYESSLQIGSEELRKTLSGLEARTQELLGIRLTQTVHRDGTKSVKKKTRDASALLSSLR